ncbi:ABC transporter permease [Candidatus Nitrosotalea bavarica]|uniref:ABC transporter permease n=1 Tax=Candidatus Nitrosotalea bavarica TaxID=1903277 RepID=UPI000C714A47|nr:ABC transporter permease [Candidatus Nitrosotalea bavarica]
MIKDIQLKKSHRNLDDAANAALFIAIFTGIWQIIFMLGIWPIISLPSPVMVAETFAKIIWNGSLPQSIGITLGRLLGAFAISITLGTLIGFTMIKFKGFGKTLNSFSAGLLSFPSIAWVPFSILFIGFNEFGIMFVVIMSSIFSIMISTYSSIRNIPTIYLDAARNMGAKGFSLFRHVTIPAATPSLIIGLRQAWSFAWHAIIGAEILMSIVGLGHILSVGREFLDMSQVIASMVTIFVIGLLVDRFLLYKMEDRIRRKWGLDHHR